MRKIVAVLALLLAVPALAQEGMEMSMKGNGAVASLKPVFEQVQGYITAAAEQVPEETYAFAPTPEVRTFGQLIGHVANANYFICAKALGEKSPATANIEKTVTSKDGLEKALAESFAYCEKAFAQDDAAAMGEADMFGTKRTRLFALAFVIAHDFEHYGNIVTYMRMNGMVPPSSQRSE